MSSPRRRTAAVAALAGAISTTLASTPAASAGLVDGAARTLSHSARAGTSANWAGYAATGGGFTSVAADWTEPGVTCRSQTSYASFWIGLDGDGSNTVEQIGTEADCSGGRPASSAWYEMFPGGPVAVPGAVSPGDSMHASVVSGGSGRFTLTIADRTRNWSHSYLQHLNNPALASAEVIAEAPSDAGGVLPLSDFGTVAFTGATANGVPLGSFHPDPITMANGGTTKATPGPLSGTGGFTVTWHSG